MAEEKKLADEALSEEELEKVAGGSVWQTADDSEFLYDYGLVEDWHGQTTTMFNWVSYSAKVDEGWSKAGITCVTKPWGDNLYFKNGKEISRKEAYDHVKASLPKIRDH